MNLEKIKKCYSCKNDMKSYVISPSMIRFLCPNCDKKDYIKQFPRITEIPIR